MGQTIVEKVAQAHLAGGPPVRPVRARDFVALRPRHVLTHDNTAAVMKKLRTIGAAGMADPRQPVFVLDHDVQNRSDANLAKYREIEAFATEHGVDFYPAGTGIGHQVVVEQAYAVPGALVVASDSHANTYGAVGALGTPVVRTDAAAIWATGEFWWQVPPTVQVVLEGELPEGVSGKDVVLALCGLYRDGEVLNAAVELAGSGVAQLSLADRLTIANMTTEWGALAGWFPVDAVTLAWLDSRLPAVAGSGRLTPEDIARWRSAPPVPDPDAAYAARITLDLGQVSPHLAGPDTVQASRPLADLGDERVPVHKAYLLSCVNGRAEDFEAAARVLRGRRVADGVELYVAPASRAVLEAATASGAWQTLLDAGAIELPPSCGPCIGLGTGLLEPGQVGISATNRNFKGRMGARDARCYLASPAVVAASAAAGFVTAPGEWPAGPPTRRFEAFAPPPAAPETVEILPGFPERLTGRLLFLPADNLNTDGIYGKDYTYREDMTREAMARVVMENYDPAFAATVRSGDVVVGGFNFGTGSSREQAVTALQAAGVPLVVAGSFSQTYLRNAFNNGFVCVALPKLVKRLREALADAVAAGSRTVVPGDAVEVDFTTGTLLWRGERFPFAPLGPVPQGLVVAGGVENQVRQRLGLA